MRAAFGAGVEAEDLAPAGPEGDDVVVPPEVVSEESAQGPTVIADRARRSRRGEPSSVPVGWVRAARRPAPVL